MKYFVIFLSVFVFFPCIVFANSAPVVSGISASQRADASRLVDIYYSLSDADGDLCTVWFSASDNGGQSWHVPVKTVSGDIGSNIAPGSNKHIIWDAGADMPGKQLNIKVRVYADDVSDEDDMVLVPAGWYAPDGTTNRDNWVYVGSYMIGKYEVTNSEYCQFLNNYANSEQYWYSSQEITQHYEAGSYYYTVEAGRDNYPVRYVRYYDATAFADWKSQVEGGNYHLPNKYQWQKAAGWSPVMEKLWTYGFQRDSISSTWCNYNNYYGGPLPVGSFDGTGDKNDAHSYYGCYDMSGNVWEWTTEPDGSYRVIRGGYWYSVASRCAVTYRGYDTPSSRYSFYGFRLVLDLN